MKSAYELARIRNQDMLPVRGKLQTGQSVILCYHSWLVEHGMRTKQADCEFSFIKPESSPNAGQQTRYCTNESILHCNWLRAGQSIIDASAFDIFSIK